MSPIEIGTETIVSRNPDIIHTEMDDEIVMINLDRGEYYGLDNIGSEIWEMLEGEISVMHLCEVLGKKYRVGSEQCLKDILPFLKEMVENEVLRYT